MAYNTRLMVFSYYKQAEKLIESNNLCVSHCLITFKYVCVTCNIYSGFSDICL